MMTFTLKVWNGITYLRSEPLYKILFNFIKHSLFVTLLLHSVTVTSCFLKINMNVYKIYINYVFVFFWTMYTCFYFIIWMFGWKMKLMLQACNTNCILLCINILRIFTNKTTLLGRWIRYYCSMSEDLALDLLIVTNRVVS